MITREELLTIINNSNIGAGLNGIQRMLLSKVAKTLSFNEEGSQEEDPIVLRSRFDLALLNGVGPAAAESAVENAIKVCKSEKLLTNISFNGNPIHNAQLVYSQNDDMEGQNQWSNVLRQFLLPRSAYLDFDRVVDPRHQIDFECGYPKFITPIMYRYLYDRDDVARRIVDIYPNESWSTDPDVTDTDDAKEITPFKESWEFLCDYQNLKQYMYRMDRLSGVGHYGVLLVGLNDGKSLEEPVDEPELLSGMQRTVGKTKREILYLRPFDEYLCFIHVYETDVNSPRYGLPLMYNLVFLDMTIDAAGASIGSRVNRKVHWTRVIHIADNLQSGNVFGIPRMQSMFNRILDLRKIKGGIGEMFWKGAFPGISFEIDPKFVTDDPDFDKEEFKREIAAYSDGLQRYLTLVGISAKTLAPNISDHPEKYVRVNLEAIAIALDMPIRVFMGSEEGKLASGEDSLRWNKRLGRRMRMHVDPNIIRASIDRFIALGCMPPPKKSKYKVNREDLNTSTDEEKANLALKWTQAMSQYVATGMVHLIKPLEYMTIFLGVPPADAIRALEGMDMTKLLKVDPSQGDGVNGKRENTTGADKDNKSDPKKRDTADKQAEGKSS